MIVKNKLKNAGANKIKISVVIPTYNRSKLLLKAIDSVLKQTHPVYEILICDDGSTDGSKDLVKSTKDRRVKWIKHKHTGLPAIPRNVGIKKANGNWIAFLDSDDEWYPNKLEKQISKLNHFECNVVYTDAVYNERVLIKKRQSKISQPFEGKVYSKLLRSNFIVNSSVIVRKDILVKLGCFDENPLLRGVEDYDMWLRVSRKYKFGYVNKVLVKYNAQGERLSKNMIGILNALITIYRRNLRFVNRKDRNYLQQRIDTCNNEIDYYENITHS